MMSSVKSVVAALLVGLGVALAAAPAQAGLDFTDTATAGISSANTTFTFVPNDGGASNATNILPGISPIPAAGPVTLSSTLAANTALPAQIVRVIFSYTGFNGNVVAADYATQHGDLLNPYNMIIQFGAINIGAVGYVELQSVSFSELNVSTFSAEHAVNRVLRDSTQPSINFSNGLLFLNTSTIPIIDRDLVDAVQLTFVIQGGSSTQINIRAVANPEPGTFALFGLGLVGVAGLLRARRRGAAAAKSA